MESIKLFELLNVRKEMYKGSEPLSEYRYGFNGQEKDDEIAGSGNSYTAEYWQYDSRLGRRWNLDPKPNPSISFYACFANNPIWFSDPLGDTIRFRDNVDSDFKNKVLEDIEKIRGTEHGAKILDRLEKSESDYYIEQIDKLLKSGFEANREDNSDPNSPFTSGGTIYLGTGTGFMDGVNFNTKYVLGHELFHAYQRDLGTLGYNALIKNKSDNGFVNLAEVQAVGFENYLRASFNEYGYNTVRKSYTTKGVLGKYHSIEIQEYTYTKGWPQFGFSWRESWSLKDFERYDNIWLYGMRDKALMMEGERK